MRPIVPAEPRAEPQMEWLSIRDFGAAGDGLADSTEALLRARQHMRLGRRQHYTLFFPPGRYVYRDNRWLMGIPSVTVEAEGASFLYQSPERGGRHELLQARTVFDLASDGTLGAAVTRHSGWRFLAPAGTRDRIRLLDPVAAEIFAPGDRVFLHGLDIEADAGPPGTRACEWHRVAQVEHRSGTLVLDGRLQHGYAQEWPDNPWFGGMKVGKPRIVNLDQPGRLYPRHVEISGARLAAMPRSLADRAVLALPAHRLRLKDCTVEAALEPWQNGAAVFERCSLQRIAGGAMCATVAFDACEIADHGHELGPAGDVVFKGSRIAGSVQLSARSAYFVGNLFQGSQAPGRDSVMALGGNLAPVGLVALRRNRVAAGSRLGCLIDNGSPRQIVTCRAGERNELVLSDSPRHRRVVLSSLERGSLVYRGDLANHGTVHEIRHQAGEWLIAGDWWQPVQAGEAWYVFDGRTIQERETRFPAGERCRLVRRLCAPQLAGRGTPARRLRLRTGAELALLEGLERHHVLGRVTRVVVTVTRPYTGPDPDPQLELCLRAGRQKWPVIGIGLRRTARVESGPDEVKADPPPLGLFRLAPDIVARYLEIGCQSGHRPLAGTPEEMPLVAVELEVEPIAGAPALPPGAAEGGEVLPFPDAAGRLEAFPDGLLPLTLPVGRG